MGAQLKSLVHVLNSKNLAFVGFHPTSLVASSWVSLPNPHNNLSPSTSQSLKGLENIGFQPPPLVSLLQYFLTHASFDVAKTNNEGEETFKGLSHAKYLPKTLILLPLPTSKDKLLLTPSQQLRIAFQKPNPNPPFSYQECTSPLLLAILS